MKHYRLTQDVVNPVRDRRCKYGIEGMEKFKKGTEFTYNPGNPKDRFAYPYITAPTWGFHVMGVTADLLVEHAEEVEAGVQLLAEEYFLHNMHGKCYLRLLEILVEDGKLTLDDVIDVFGKLNAVFDAEEGR